MSREEFSKKTKYQAWSRCDGRCEAKGCGVKLMPGRFEYDHVIPAALGGPPTLENCAVLCDAHHKLKTRTRDIPAIAKVNRIRIREAGIKKKSSFRGWRSFSGEIIKAR